MALLDIFKKKKPKKEVIELGEKREAKGGVEKKKPSFAPASAKASAGKKATEGKEEFKPKPVKQKTSVFAYKILKTPHVTEKASNLSKGNQYVFKVFPKANKTEIKKAIESVYGVEVETVKIINMPSKKKRVGRIEGERSGYKKAIAKVKKGQEIEIMPR